ncbi:hypothetical protein PNEG_01541 [Pneumocystis murina B123]|uniref:UBA domain-containing protein n=1 Tax=Pneumocystis murina (strain B123) TaxID=1069680 RepID=M7NSP5_PNEMU|nr:hypothetical protein PNEG_01541 [Pneumocystis murina B123]EMR10277.1 hypothetical protein PNEG_01541 [Pneumocystis murina B123]
MQEKEILEEKQDEKEKYRDDTNESYHLSFSDLNNYFYENTSKSVSEQSSQIRRKKSRLKYEDLAVNNKSLLDLNDDSYKGLESNTFFNELFFDDLSSLSKSSIRDHEVDDVFEIFNTPVQDFIQNNNSNNQNNLNFQKKDSFLDSKSNGHDISNDEIISQLVNMGFDYTQVIRAIDTTHVKSDINSIISVLMSLDLLDNEETHNPSKSGIIDKKEDLCSLDNLHFFSKFFNKANNIFNSRRNCLKPLKNHNMQSNNYYDSSKHHSLLSNQKLFKAIKNSDKTVASETSTSIIEKNNDLMDFLSDEPNYQPSLSSIHTSKLFSSDIETQNYKKNHQNLAHCSINSEESLLFDLVSQDLFTEHSDQFNLPPLINQVNLNMKHASDAFNNGNYSKALELYSEFIKYLPSNHVLRILLLSNRSLCYLHMEKLELSLLDCDELLKLIENKRGFGKNISSEKIIDDIWKRIIIRRSQCLQRLKGLGEAKGQQEEAINLNIDDLMTLNSKNNCEKILKSDTLLDVDFSENSKNQNSISKPEKEPFEKVYNLLKFENEDKSLLYNKVESFVNNWADGKENNIRALLSSLSNVLWDDLAWQNINMANLLSISQVKKAYIKAISKIHPDKLPITTSLEQKMIASSVFNTLNNAWSIFKTKNNI